MLKNLVKSIVPSQLWTIIRLAKLRNSVSSFEPYQTKRNIAGHSFNIKIADPLARGWYDQDWEKLPEIEFLKNYTLIPGARVFDLGAHQGIVAQILGEEVSPNGKVIALEANKHNAEIAKENVFLNQNEAVVEIVHAAISDKIGEITFNEGLNGKVDDGSGEWGKVLTKALTIDYLCEAYGIPDLIFLDVEGFEMHALVGAQKSFQSISSWFIEVHADYQLQSFGSTPLKVIEKFPTSDYQRFIANEVHKNFVVFDENSAAHQTMIQKRFFFITIKK